MRFLSISVFVVALALGACGTDSGENTAPDADVTETADAGAPGAFMTQCAENTDCESNLCFQFNSKGPHCTHECVNDDDCEDPSPGCNNKGVCKAPDL